MATQTAVLPEKVINFIEASSALAEKAAADERARRDTEKQAAALIPGIVDTLAAIQVDGAGGPVPLLEADEKTACADALADHVRTLSILTKVAGHLKKAQADRLGRGDGKRREKTAGAESPFTGRRTSEEPESWRRFRRNIMGG